MKLLQKSLLLIAFIGLSHTAFPQGTSINDNGSAPDPSAMLDVSATDKGFLLPRMTTTERDAISGPAEGLQIFNTTTKCLEFYVYGTWQTLKCASCPTPSAPAAASHSTTETSITWNWNTVAGASGYKYNTVNDYNSATDNGSSTSFIQTGLACNNTYTLYVWSYISCGESSPMVMSQSTSACPCGATVTFTYKGSTVTYGTVSSLGKCWMDRNLGASQVATALNDANAYGDLFQWGRGDDGHQSRTSGTTSTLSTTDNPGNGNFILAPNSPWDWRSPSNNNLWNGVNGINNPCPSGWRIPTEAEFQAEINSWSQKNTSGAFASPLKLTAGGGRDFSNASLYLVGDYGYYWLIGNNPSDIRAVGNTSSAAGVWNYYRRAIGKSVRCIKD